MRAETLKTRARHCLSVTALAPVKRHASRRFPKVTTVTIALKAKGRSPRMKQAHHLIARDVDHGSPGETALSTCLSAREQTPNPRSMSPGTAPRGDFHVPRVQGGTAFCSLLRHSREKLMKVFPEGKTANCSWRQRSRTRCRICHTRDRGDPPGSSGGTPRRAGTGCGQQGDETVTPTWQSSSCQEAGRRGRTSWLGGQGPAAVPADTGLLRVGTQEHVRREMVTEGAVLAWGISLNPLGPPDVFNQESKTIRVRP